MIKGIIIGLIIALFGVVCFYKGWRIAHLIIASECKRNGGFFVDKDDFKCIHIEKAKK